MNYRKSEHVKIRDVEDDIQRVNNLLVDYAFDTDIKEKDYLRLRLLTEEVTRLIKQILGKATVELWFEGNRRVTNIIMETKALPEGTQKDELKSITTSGEINDDRGFFGKLSDMFFITQTEEKHWSLAEYKRQLKEKKQEDQYSLEAWEDLERSLVANLADDIVISTGYDGTRMVVTKDFTASRASFKDSALEASTRQIIVGTGKDVTNELDKAEDLIAELSLDRKNALHAKLVFEETLGMLKEMTENYQAVIWLEKYRNGYCVKLTAKTEMDYNKKKELLSMASNKKNDSVKGFMDKVGDVIQNGLLSYEYTANLSQEYNGGMVNYGSLGMYGSIEGASEYGVLWSMDDYRQSLEDERENQESAQQAWDELEKSIVANIASDVVVGVKGDRVDMTIICKYS